MKLEGEYKVDRYPDYDWEEGGNNSLEHEFEIQFKGFCLVVSVLISFLVTGFQEDWGWEESVDSKEVELLEFKAYDDQDKEIEVEEKQVRELIKNLI